MPDTRIIAVNPRFRLAMAAVLAAVICIAASAPAFSQTKKDLSDVQSTLEEKKAAAAELKKKSAALNKEIGKIEDDLVSKAKNLRSLETKLGALDGDLKKLRQERAQIEKKLENDRTSIVHMVSSMQRMRRLPPQTLVSDPSNARRTVHASAALRIIMPQIETRARDLSKKIEDLNATEEAINKKSDEHGKAKSKLASQQKSLNLLLVTQKKTLSATEKQRAAEEAEAKELASKAKSLEDLLRKIAERAKAAQKKTASKGAAPGVDRKPPPGLVLPVYGNIRTAYGEKDELGAKSLGITIVGGNRATVVSPLAGKVKFAGPFQKFKQILIIEHSDGFHSLIAGLDVIDTAVGASVRASQPVGKLSATAAPKLYYELRSNGAPINPEKALARAK